jgi:nitroreductase
MQEVDAMFLQLARQRVSIRAYKPDPVEEEKLEQVLEAGRLAPSACNRQPWGFVVIRDPERRRALKAAYDREWFASAPLIIAVCCDTRAAWRRSYDGVSYAWADAAIAVDHMTLAAADLGLGTCWVCAFDPSVVRRLLELPEHVEPFALLPLGYPAEPGRAKDRKPSSAVVHAERWNGPA